MSVDMDMVRETLKSRWLFAIVVAGALPIMIARLLRTQNSSLNETVEPDLFKEHSSYHSLNTSSGFLYPKIRIFYHAHPQGAILPKNLPLIVFMHGLGGNATQFSPLLKSLVKIASCLAIDLPGCGLSDFQPDQMAAYTTGAFAEVLYAAIERYRNTENDQKIVLIGHSMGSSICALLASSTSPLGHLLNGVVIGFVALNPRANSPTPKETESVKRLRWMHPLVFDLLRAVDRRGGTQSASIVRVVGEGADEETRRLQMQYNRRSKSTVFLRFLIATLPPDEKVASKPHVGWPGKGIWAGITMPLFIVGGQADKLTSPKDVDQIAHWLLVRPLEKWNLLDNQIENNKEDVIEPKPIHHPRPKKAERDPSTNDELPNKLDLPKNASLVTKIFSSPAAHGLMYDSATVNELAGDIEEFICKHIDGRVSVRWQAEYLATYTQ